MVTRYKGGIEQDLALEIHSLISIEIGHRANNYMLTKHEDFFKALNTIDQLDEYLEYINKYELLYAKTFNSLFKLLKKLDLDQLITNMIINRYGKNCIFLKFNQDNSQVM